MNAANTPEGEARRIDLLFQSAILAEIRALRAELMWGKSRSSAHRGLLERYEDGAREASRRWDRAVRRVLGYEAPEKDSMTHGLGSTGEDFSARGVRRIPQAGSTMTP